MISPCGSVTFCPEDQSWKEMAEAGDAARKEETNGRKETDNPFFRVSNRPPINTVFRNEIVVRFLPVYVQSFFVEIDSSQGCRLH